MKRLATVAVFVLVAAACSGDGAAVTTTAPPPTNTTSPAPPTTTVPPTTAPAEATSEAPTTTTTTTTVAPVIDRPDILIAGEEGVIVWRADGTSDTLVTGPVAFALDDTGGGLLFQLRRGRRFFGDVLSTEVWWVEPGSTEARQLLVPAADQDLTLYEAYYDDDLVVWYTRWEGAEQNTIETLRRFDAATGEVTEFDIVAGFESGALLSFGGGTIARSWGGEGLCGMYFTDLAGQAIDFPAAPEGVLEGNDCGLVAEAGELSPDGARFAYLELVRAEDGTVLSTDVVVVDGATGEETTRVVGVRPEQAPWRIIDLDLADDTLLVNRTSSGEDVPLPPLVIDLSGEEPVVMEPPIPGWARLVRAPLELGGRVTGPGS